jgi:hypothetical protein
MAIAFRLPAGAVLLALALLVAPAHAAATFAQLKNLSGDVQVSPRNNGSWIAASPSTGLGNNDAVRTGANGGALLVHGRSELFLKPNTVTVIGYSSVQIRQGSLWFRMQKSEIGFKFVTDVAAATIRGTMGLITATTDMTTVSLLKGRVEVKGEVDDKVLEPRNEAVVRRGRRVQVAPIPGSRQVSLLSDFHKTERDAGASGGGGGKRSTPDGDLRGQVGPRDSRGFPIPGLDPRTGASMGFSGGGSMPSPTIGVAGSAPRLGVQSLLPGGSTAGIGGAVGTIGGAVGSIGGTVGGAIGTIGAGVGGAIGTIGAGVGGAVGSVGGTVGGAVGPIGGAVGGAIGGPIGGAVGGATGTVGGAIGAGAGAVGGAIGGATGTVGGIVGGATGTVGGIVGGATGGAGGLLGGGTGGATGGGGGLFGK